VDVASGTIRDYYPNFVPGCHWKIGGGYKKIVQNNSTPKKYYDGFMSF
jgi:hypothetical protein